MPDIDMPTASSDVTVLRSFSTVIKEFLPGEFPTSTCKEIEYTVEKAAAAFPIYSRKSAGERAGFLEAIGEEIMALGDELIQRTMLESGLPEARLTGERTRTVNQLKLFAELIREGSWIEAVIDTAQPDRKPLPRPDLRKMLAPVGPVLVFGASNFPFAFSTAGGDTAAALAAGCPVIVKAHEAHLGTHQLITSAIHKAAAKTNISEGVFSSLIISDHKIIHHLVIQEGIQAIGFTGSYMAGMSVYRAATLDRKSPIPVYAEMSSVNPVLILPQKLEQEGTAIAAQLAASITLGVGQFCTNPGLIFLIESPAAANFIESLRMSISQTVPGPMLNAAVCDNYYSSKQLLQDQPGIQVLAETGNAAPDHKGTATLLKTSAGEFVKNEKLQSEVFGPLSLVVCCADAGELLQSMRAVHGQLTGTVYGTKEELRLYRDCIDQLISKVGRIIFNGVPTGVEVCHAMVHGGPFPATTHAGSTSVGADAIKRFTRPICYQDCAEELLPDELKNDNSRNIMRKINGQFTRNPINS